MIYILAEVVFSHTRVGNMSYCDGFICRSHKGIEGCHNHFGLGEATAAFGQNRTDGESLHVKGQLVTEFVSERERREHDSIKTKACHHEHLRTLILTSSLRHYRPTSGRSCSPRSWGSSGVPPKPQNCWRPHKGSEGPAAAQRTSLVW